MATESVHEVHGVDISWLHHCNRDFRHLPRTSSSPAQTPDSTRTSSPAPQSLVEEKTPSTTAVPIPQRNESPLPTPALSSSAPMGRSPKKPGLLSRSSSDKLGASPEDGKKKSTWMSSLKSKVASSSTQQPQQPSTPPTPQTLGSFLKSQTAASQTKEPSEPQEPPQATRSSSFTRALKRLSSNSNVNTPTKPCGPGTTCPRRVLNKDEARDRNPVTGLESTPLKRVAFSVDVEIAGHSRYTAEDPPVDAEQKHKDKKLKEQGEGAALKRPDLAEAEKEKEESSGGNSTAKQTPTSENPASKPQPIPTPNKVTADWDDQTDLDFLYSNHRSGSYDQATSRAQREAEEERRRAKEERKRRKEAEAQAKIEANSQAQTQSQSNAPAQSPAASDPPPSAAKGDRPTTDPLRMYRRCCALREAPVLKRIKEQLERPINVSNGGSGLVTHLDLTGSRMQLSDIVCLSDWLAIVPVKQIILENSNLTDEGVRIILAGLSAAKPPETVKRKRGRSSPTRLKERDSYHTPGVIEKISFRNNPKITRKGWKYIFLFITMCRSIRALDLSQIPFAASDGTTPSADEPDMGDLLWRAITKRLAGSHLEEMNLSECALSTTVIRKLTDAITMSRLQRLGLAGNNINDDGLECIANYVRQGTCQGLDISSNNFRGKLHVLAEALHPQNNIMLLGLENCNLESKDLLSILPAIQRLKSFRGLDLSHNHELFVGTPCGLHILRKWLPQMPVLKRLHLEDVNMTPALAIGLAEIIPDVRNLCHLSLLNNPALKALSTATSEEQSEEACALYASLMAAARVSKTLMAIDIEIPSADSSEMAKALAKQALAYCIRNMERFTAADGMYHTDSASKIPDEAEDVSVPEILAHLVGGLPDEDGRSAPKSPLAPLSAVDPEYFVGGTGVVKALQCCLGQKAADIRRTSGFNSPSGTASPTTPITSENANKAKAMSLALLQSARKIRASLQGKLLQASHSDDEMAHRRLQFFNNKLDEIITRFEDEYPESRPSPRTAPQSQPLGVTQSGLETSKDAAFTPYKMPIVSASQDHAQTQQTAEATSDTASTDRASDAGSDSDVDTRVHSPSRRQSSASTANQILSAQEGDMLRLGQRMRRNFLRPVGTDDHLHKTSTNDEPEAAHLVALRQRLEEMHSSEIREMMENLGLEKTYESFNDMASMLEMLQREQPDCLGGLMVAQTLAAYNAGKISREEAENEVGQDAIEEAMQKPNGVVKVQ